MMGKKTKRLYGRMQHGISIKQSEIQKLQEKEKAGKEKEEKGQEKGQPKAAKQPPKKKR